MTTYSAKPSEITRKWYIIDATDLVLGRLACEVTTLLRGKHKPCFSNNIDCGDHVIVINAGKVHLTGKKYDDKMFYWHTGHPGGIKERTARATLEGRFPERLLEKAIERMFPKESPLSREQRRKLHIYAGSEHAHAGQKPEVYDFASKNIKNKKRKAA